MSNLLNKLTVVNSAKNTGVGRAFLDPKKIEGALILPQGTRFTAAAIAAGFRTALDNMALAAIDARLFPIHGFTNITDGSEDLIIETLGYGAKKPVREGFNDWKFEFTRGGLTLSSKLRAFNGQAPDVLFYDAEGTVLGRNDAGDLTGIPQEYFWQSAFKINNGSQASKYFTGFNFHPRYLNDFPAFVKVDFDITAVKGLIDVNLSATMASNVATVTAETDVEAVNMAVLYPALGATGAWVLTNDQTGATVTITSVTISNGKFVVTVDTTAWTALTTGQTLSLKMAAPSVLAAAPYNAKGYESKVLTLTK